MSGNTGRSFGPHLHIGFMGPNGKFINPETINDLQEFIDNGYQVVEKPVNENNPIKLREVTVTAKETYVLKQKQVQEESPFNYPNAYGNTGRYNKPNRTSDAYYSDDFLIWYYGK